MDVGAHGTVHIPSSLDVVSTAVASKVDYFV